MRAGTKISTRSPCRTSIAYSATGIFLMSSSGIPGRNVSAMALRPCELSSSISCQWILPGQHTSRGDTCGDAYYAKCYCVSGAAGACRHIAALRFALKKFARKDWKKAFHRTPVTSNMLWFQQLEQIHRKPFPLFPQSPVPERSAGVSFLCDVFHLWRLSRSALSAVARDRT